MDIVDLYFSDQEFSPEQERQIFEEYQAYLTSLEEEADRTAYRKLMGEID